MLEQIRVTNNNKDTIQILNDFIGEIESSPKKYITKLSNEIEEFAYHIQRCPLCGDKLKIFSYEECRGEYQGFNCKESMYKFECPNTDCGYTR